jgi:hypothetical protein
VLPFEVKAARWTRGTRQRRDARCRLRVMAAARQGVRQRRVDMAHAARGTGSGGGPLPLASSTWRLRPWRQGLETAMRETRVPAGTTSQAPGRRGAILIQSSPV